MWTPDEPSPARRCPLHLQPLNEGETCKWCDVARGQAPMKPWNITPRDRAFLKDLKIDPEDTQR